MKLTINTLAMRTEGLKPFSVYPHRVIWRRPEMIVDFQVTDRTARRVLRLGTGFVSVERSLVDPGFTWFTIFDYETRLGQLIHPDVEKRNGRLDLRKVWSEPIR